MSRPAELSTDYLVVGAGASAMAFVDELLRATDGPAADAEVVIVDRRHAPGGHWLDAYPFVRLHQPSAYYGVGSLALGHDRLQTSGDEAGFYERASGAEIVDYYQRVLDEIFLPTGRVRFLGEHEYRGTQDGAHHVVSTLTGTPTTVHVRRRLVDATYVASEIPARHVPGFAVEYGARLVTPNDLVDVADAPTGFTVIGGGKTAMDTCTWLLDNGVDADAIAWVRPRDGWFVDRRVTQPFEQSVGMIEYQARLAEAAASEPDAPSIARRLEAHGIFHRLDSGREPEVFRGATLATAELTRLRAIEQVIRLGRVRRLSATELTLEQGSLAGDRQRVYVDCTAQGLATSPTAPVFQGDRILLQFTTLGVAPWSAAIVGHVESLDLSDDERNRRCPPVPRTGLIADYDEVLAAGFAAENARRADAELQAWASTSRLNPGRSIPTVLHDPDAQAFLAVLMNSMEGALAAIGGRRRIA